MSTLQGKTILLIISGGIAAYKALELIRLLKKNGALARCILTQGGAHFVTPLSVSALSEHKTYTDLWSLTDETEMGHIRLSRECDLILIAPASANLLAKMAHGIADDLASTTLLAADKPIMAAPAMNPMMWHNSATQTNIETLRTRGIQIIGPADGNTACGENGLGRLLEPENILDHVVSFFAGKPLKGFSALITAGPTHEPVDPVRFIGNHSSGKQGYAIASALQNAGAAITLITGPTALPDPSGVKTIRINTAQEMLNACQATVPVDIAICAAAVSDWRTALVQDHKIKKHSNAAAPTLALEETPDILKILSQPGPHRPRLVIGFAAETRDVLSNARAKLKGKKCDWLIANQVGATMGFGTDHNTVSLLSADTHEDWPTMSKIDIAKKLTQCIIEHFRK